MMHQQRLKIPMYLGLLVILALPLLVTPHLAVPYITGKNFAFRLVVDLLFSFYILLMLYDTRYQPRFSWILVSILALLFFSILSSILGVDPKFSFLGSYARMDGVVTWIHLLMYFIVLSHFLNTQNEWSYFFYVSCLVAVIVVICGVTDYTPTSRLISTLGNVQFSAMYLFYQMGLVVFLMVQTSNHRRRFILGCMGVVITIGLLSTGERGVFCALFFGISASIAYLLQSRQILNIRYFIMAIVFSAFIFILLSIYPPAVLKHYPVIARYFDIHYLKDAFLLRGNLWGIGLKGVKDHPLLGWGMSNFSYIFNQYYDPFYCTHEVWFDNVHNNYLDWLISSGIFGLLSYLALLITPLMYVCKLSKTRFTLNERTALIGLMTGIFVVNLFYFDTLPSYICFFNMLAFIHAQVAVPLRTWIIPRKYISVMVMPGLLIATTSLVFYLTLPSLLAAREAMFATGVNDIRGQYLWMHQAWSRQGIGNIEILDRLNQMVIGLLGNDKISSEEKYYVAHQTEAELKDFIRQKPRDPRAYYALSLLYAMMSQFDDAKEAIQFAQKLTPHKEYTLMLNGTIELAMGHVTEAQALFKKSKCLLQSRTLYLESTGPEWQVQQFYASKS